MNLAEFLALFIPKCRDIKFAKQVEITTTLLEKAQNYKEIQLTYGIIVLALQLDFSEYLYV